MILQSLCQLYDRLKDDPDYLIAPFGYSLQRISFKVVITPEGELFDVQDARVESGSRRVARQIVVPGGSKPTGAVTDSSVHDKVLPLRGELPFLLGGRIEEQTDSRDKTKKLHVTAAAREFEAFRAFHLGLQSEVSDPGFSAVCRFLERWEPAQALQHQEWTEIADGQGVFQIVGEAEFVHDRLAVRKWWDQVRHSRLEAFSAQCLITGRQGNVARTHNLVKGLRGGNTTGGAIVGFNDSAYESYGRGQSLNAPVSVEAAFCYVTALNALLDGPKKLKHRISLGETTVAFWTDRPSPAEDIFAAFIEQGSELLTGGAAQDESVRKRLESFLVALRKGREAYAELDRDPGGTAFFIFGLSPNAARIAVRFFHRATLGELLDNLRRHYRDIEMIRRPATERSQGDPEYPSVQLLLDQTSQLKDGRPDREKIPPVLGGPMLRAVLTGSRYPQGLFSAVLRRVQTAEKSRDGKPLPRMNYARACVIKGYLTRNLGKEIGMSLDFGRTDPAYRLGRLFAALEKTQRDAHDEKINTTIRESYYGSASATPRPVFPRLLRTYQHHLAKLEGGRRVTREKLVQEILAPLRDIPPHLNLEGQGLFALGYYQQMRDFYTGKDERAAEDAQGGE